MGDVAFQRRPHHHRPRRLVEGADFQQHAAHVGMHDDRIGRLVRRLSRPTASGPAGGRAHRPRRSGRRLPTAPAPARATPSRASFIITNMALQALVLLADQPALRAVVIHHAGGVAVNAHLVFDRAAGDARCARPASRRRRPGTFGTMNSEMPLMPAGAPSMRASTRWTMFSVRSCSPAEMKIFWPVIA